MIDQGLSASTINVRLSAIRKLVSEARENICSIRLKTLAS
jgi:hypothetical protein